MSKETVLARVEADLAERDFGKARDRLNTLVVEYPDDLDLRARLATVYDALGLPAMAGRFWFFQEERTGHGAKAVVAFERSCGGDALLMLSALKFQGDPDRMPTHARARLDALRQAVQERYGFMPRPYESSRMLGRGRGTLNSYARAELARDRPPRARRRGTFVVLPRHLVDVRVFLGMLVVAGLAGTGLVSILWWTYQAIR